MYKYIVILFSLFLISCTTKYITTPLTQPPDKYMPRTIATEKDVVGEYQRALIQIAKWQGWYNIQVGSNYYTNKK